MTKVRYLLLLSMLSTSCIELPEASQEQEESSRNNDSSYVTQDAINYTGDISALQGIDLVYDTKGLFLEDVSANYSFSAVNLPSFLTLSSSTGTLSGEPDTNGIFDNIVITATNISDTSIKYDKTVSVAVNGDPLREYAWHLNNTGQKNFSNRAGTSGADINVSDVYKIGITGSGVKLAFSDTGVEINHDDLFVNSLTNDHRDYSLNWPYVGNPTPTNSHGTSVVGLANAVGWNNHGSMGVAPNAKFAGFQFLDSVQSSSILLHQATGDFDIFNYSYGDTLYYDTLSDADYIDHLREQTISSNKVYVKAAGNEHLQYNSDFSICASHNANFPFENESPFMIVVGALDADGFKSTYSNAGSNIWISAPGGEFGESSAGGDPAMMTTDLPTCFKGYSKAGANQTNSFEYGHSLNSQCHYTSTMNGTSSAVPVMTGVIALLREANSQLKMRDIKHILARTAFKTDAGHSNVFGTSHLSSVASACSDLSLGGHDYELGWVTNKAPEPYHFNNFYGFGRVDAKAAVDLAQNYTFPLGTQVELNKDFNNNLYKSTSSSLSIPNDSSDSSVNRVGLTDTLSVSTSLTLESVQVKVRVTHPNPGEIGIELTSPDGTTSILQNINNTFLLSNSEDLNIVLTTNAFYGEQSAGNWTLRVIDGQTGSHSGVLVDWKINILGH